MSADPSARNEDSRDDLPSVQRLLSLSDGVVAIALTLFTISVMPFTSGLLGEYSSNPLAVDIFAINLMLAGLAGLATQATMAFGRRRGLVRGGGAAGVRAERARAVATMLVIGLSIGVAWVNTSAAKYCWLLLAVAPWAVDRWSGRRQPA